MRSLLEELWYGNVCPDTQCHQPSQEKEKLKRYITEHHDKLYATLSDEQKAVWTKLDDCHAELADINEREIFVYAFRLGARMMVESMQQFLMSKKAATHTGCHFYLMIEKRAPPDGDALF